MIPEIVVTIVMCACFVAGAISITVKAPKNPWEPFRIAIWVLVVIQLAVIMGGKEYYERKLSAAQQSEIVAIRH